MRQKSRATGSESNVGRGRDSKGCTLGGGDFHQEPVSEQVPESLNYIKIMFIIELCRGIHWG